MRLRRVWSPGRLHLGLLAILLLGLLQACRPACPPPPRLLILGDSTAAALSAEPSGHMGWGEALDAMLKGIDVENRALPGASAKSFLNEAWPGIRAGLRPGDVVLVQFGQNDPAADARRHGDPDGAYRDALARFVVDVRAAGGLPVLLTPLARHRFDASGLRPAHGRYPEATRELAAGMRVPLIDLTSWSEAALTRLGPTRAMDWFRSTRGVMDGVHFGRQGAQAAAREISSRLEALAADQPLIGSLLSPPAACGR